MRSRIFHGLPCCGCGNPAFRFRSMPGPGTAQGAARGRAAGDVAVPSAIWRWCCPHFEAKNRLRTCESKVFPEFGDGGFLKFRQRPTGRIVSHMKTDGMLDVGHDNVHQSPSASAPHVAALLQDCIQMCCRPLMLSHMPVLCGTVTGYFRFQIQFFHACTHFRSGQSGIDEPAIDDQDTSVSCVTASTSMTLRLVLPAVMLAG